MQSTFFEAFWFLSNGAVPKGAAKSITLPPTMCCSIRVIATSRSVEEVIVSIYYHVALFFRSYRKILEAQSSWIQLTAMNSGYMRRSEVHRRRCLGCFSGNRDTQVSGIVSQILRISRINFDSRHCVGTIEKVTCSMSVNLCLRLPNNESTSIRHQNVP